MKKIIITLMVLLQVGQSDPQGVYEDRCRGCHGYEGETKAMGKSSPIRYLRHDEIVKRLEAYKSGTRNEYGMGAVMKGQMVNYDSEYIGYLADYIFSLSDNIVKTIDRYNVKLTITYPKKVKEDNYFTVLIEARSKVEKVSRGGVTLSLPQFKELNGMVGSYNFDSVREFQPPQKMYNKIAKKSKKIHYVAIEGWEKKWKGNESKKMEIKFLAQKGERTFHLKVRGVFIVPNKEKTFMPFESEDIDQQGYAVESIYIPIEEK